MYETRAGCHLGSQSSHHCDPGSTLASKHMWAELQSIDLNLILRVFLGVLRFSSLIKIDSQLILSDRGRIPSIGITSGILAIH